MASKKRFEDVCSTKICVCKKSFRDEECEKNIKRHCDTCDQYQSAKKRKKVISNYFLPSTSTSTRAPSASEIVSTEPIATAGPTGEQSCNSQRDPNTAEIDTEIVPIEPIATASPTGEQSCNSQRDPNTPEIDAEIVPIEPITTGEKFCCGFELFRERENDFYACYPFTAHSSLNKQAGAFQTFIPIDGAVFSTKCRDRKFKLNCSTLDICDDCKALKSLNSVKGIIERANFDYDDLKKTNNVYLGQKQMIEKLEAQRKCIDQMSLENFNDHKKLNVLKRKLGHYQRFLVTLSEKDVPRLRQLIAVCLRQKNGISYVLNKLSKAMRNLYKPQGYNENDNDLAAFLLISGGPRVLHVLHQTSGLPSLSTAYRIIDKENFLKGVKLTASCANEFDVLLKQNIEKVLAVNSSPDSVVSIKVDELAVEKRLRYKSDTNEVIGLCCQHTKPNDVVFVNAQFAETLSDDLASQKLHLATESCVFTICNLGDIDYNAKPMLSMPICSHATANEQNDIFYAIFDLWESHFSESNTLVNIGTDGDAVRRSVLHNMATEKLSEDVSYYPYLKDLTYMDMLTLPMGVTVDYDGKHLAKCVRGNTLSGSIKNFGKSFDSSFLKIFLKYLNYPDNEINSMLCPDDKQNVPLAVKLLKSFNKDYDVASLPVGFMDMVSAISAMNVICQGVLAFFDSTNLSIDEQLGRLSAMSHMLLFLKTSDDLEMLNVLYHDLQASVQNAFFTAAKFKADFPEKRLHLFQLGSDQVEHLFRNVRTQNHDRNCDTYQLESRLGRSAILDRIFIKHADWKQKSVRLTGDTDHTNPSHWKGNYACKDISLFTAWKWGKATVKNVLRNFEEDKIPADVTMMKPLGVYIGVKTDEAETEPDMEPINNDETHDQLDDSHENDELFTQFEDEIENGAADTHAITIKLNGKEMYKSSAVRLISSGIGIKKSGDRLRRVQGLSKFMSQKPGTPDVEDDDNIIAVRDPVATLCSKQGCLSLAVMFVDKIVDVEKKNVSYVNREAPEATISGRPLSLKSCDNWFEVNIGERNKVMELKCNVQMCVPIEVGIGNEKYRFQTDRLKEIFDALLVKAKTFTLKLPSRNIELFNGDERVLFKRTNVGRQDDGASVNCGACNKKIKIDKMREHIGGHLIRKDIDCFSCGFCGGSTGCSISLKKTTHKTSVPQSNCSMYKKFSLASAKTSTSSSTCTNRPVLCVICNATYWSYALNKHYEQKHSESTCPEVVSETEIEIMKKK